MTTPWRRTDVRPSQRLAALLVAAVLSVSLAQAPIAEAPTAAERGRVALILSGGAARGAAHVGVIRTLVDAGVPIDFIVGTSMGSLIGGLYAAGFDAQTLAAVVDAVDPSGAGELLLPPRGGFLDATPLAMMIDALTGGIDRKSVV